MILEASVSLLSSAAVGRQQPHPAMLSCVIWCNNWPKYIVQWYIYTPGHIQEHPIDGMRSTAPKQTPKAKILKLKPPCDHEFTGLVTPADARHNWFNAQPRIYWRAVVAHRPRSVANRDYSLPEPCPLSAFRAIQAMMAAQVGGIGGTRVVASRWRQRRAQRWCGNGRCRQNSGSAARNVQLPSQQLNDGVAWPAPCFQAAVSQKW